MTCKARQYSDQMLCPCGLAWDTNDPEPPICPEDGKQAPMSGCATDPKEVGRRTLDQLKATLA